jgi:dihydrofolate reductase
MQLISIIAAIAKNNVIGNNGRSPWTLSENLRWWFRKMTIGKPVLMGRKTFASIGKTVPDCTNIVITSDKKFNAPGCLVVHSLADALHSQRHARELFIIGGATLFRQCLRMADKMYLTIIDRTVFGDTYFPYYDLTRWNVISDEREHNTHLSRLIFEKKSSTRPEEG